MDIHLADRDAWEAFVVVDSDAGDVVVGNAGRIRMVVAEGRKDVLEAGIDHFWGNHRMMNCRKKHLLGARQVMK